MLTKGEQKHGFGFDSVCIPLDLNTKVSQKVKTVLLYLKSDDIVLKKMADINDII